MKISGITAGHRCGARWGEFPCRSVADHSLSRRSIEAPTAPACITAGQRVLRGGCGACGARWREEGVRGGAMWGLRGSASSRSVGERTGGGLRRGDRPVARRLAGTGTGTGTGGTVPPGSAHDETPAPGGRGLGVLCALGVHGRSGAARRGAEGQRRGSSPARFSQRSSILRMNAESPPDVEGFVPPPPPPPGLSSPADPLGPVTA